MLPSVAKDQSKTSPICQKQSLDKLRPHSGSTMSLFGSSPNGSDLANPTPRHKSLFDEASTAGVVSSTSLFDDGADGNAGSPWTTPTPKKAAADDLVKSLLSASDVPESYIDAFDAMLDSGDKSGTGISLDEVNKLLGSSGLGADGQRRILDLVVPNGKESSVGLRRPEFNVLLALVGLAQENEELTLDGVDERRKSRRGPNFHQLGIC